MEGHAFNMKDASNTNSQMATLSSIYKSKSKGRTRVALDRPGIVEEYEKLRAAETLC